MVDPRLCVGAYLTDERRLFEVTRVKRLSQADIRVEVRDCVTESIRELPAAVIRKSYRLISASTGS